MDSPAVYITEKVMDTTRGLVYLALRFRRRRGATTADLSDFVNARIPSEHGLHAGLVGRVLVELDRSGLATRHGEHWFAGGAAA